MCLFCNSERQIISGLNIFIREDPNKGHPLNVMSYDSNRYASRSINPWEYHCFIFQHYATSGGGIFDYGYVGTFNVKEVINWVATRLR